MLTYYACKSQIGFTLHTEVWGWGSCQSARFSLKRVCLHIINVAAGLHRHCPACGRSSAVNLCWAMEQGMGVGEGGRRGCIRQQSRKHSPTIVLEPFGLCTAVSHFRLRLCLAFREAKMSDDTDDHKQSI